MHYVCEVDIAAPRDAVIALFDAPQNLSRWQPDLLRFEPLSGTAGQPGARSRLVYRAGRGEFELIETVMSRNLPDEFCGTYESRMGITTIRNKFVDQGSSTRWIVDTEFRGRGLMRFMSVLLQGMMRAQTLKMVHAFRDFAEAAAR